MPLKSAWSIMENSKSCGSESASALAETEVWTERLRLNVRCKIEV